MKQIHEISLVSVLIRRFHKRTAFNSKGVRMVKKSHASIACAIVLSLVLTGFGLISPASASTRQVPPVSIAESNALPAESDISDVADMLETIENIPDSALSSDETLEKYLGSVLTKELSGSSISVLAQPAGIDWGNTAKCGAAIGQALLGVAVPAVRLARIKTLIKELGGVWESAKLLVGAGTAAEKGEAAVIALGSLVAELAGIPGIVNACPKVWK